MEKNKNIYEKIMTSCMDPVLKSGEISVGAAIPPWVRLTEDV